MIEIPAKYDRCIRDVKKKIKSGEIPKYYQANGRKKSSAYAICSRLRATGKPKRDGSGRGIRANRGRGGCSVTKMFGLGRKTTRKKSKTFFGLKF